jgi:hypothetical protein
MGLDVGTADSDEALEALVEDARDAGLEVG